MVDPVEAIADAQVAFLNGDKSGWAADYQPDISFVAIKSADPTEYLKVERLTTTQVFVVPFGESFQKTDRGGGGMETYSTYLLIVRGLAVDFTRETLAHFARQLKLAMRKQNRMAGYVFAGDETTFKYSMEALKETDHFANSTVFTYRGMA